ncbi:hypothetical protein SCALIN_C04_0375 [Candidatus Scalindua japonica]|uniref:SxtJ n=1 Tax=Candidatus Scalindua japonica TaxID=1284222 RepID=A0A286TVF8_9BACT|nr:SxtJ family membrane protein [Candidatus Scalindua japonica]GAX59887.1 hypothetical protein SCALIN_C04_0375 [Candidatus Scalindua japonica]
MRKPKDEIKEIKKFGFGLTALLCLVGGLQYYKGHVDVCVWFFGFAGLVITLAFFTPIILKPVFKVITTVGNAIGWVNTRIILGIIYYLIFTPIGLFAKLIGKDFLDERIERNAKSYWVKKDSGLFSKKQFERQF